MSDPDIRTFTLEEANALVPEVRPVLEALRDAHAAMERHHDDVMGSVPTNGGGEVHRAFLEASQSAARAQKDLGDRGIIVRDPSTGLIDFPAIRDGELVYLCWKLGEDAIGWWHPPEAGFAGRRPL